MKKFSPAVTSANGPKGKRPLSPQARRAKRGAALGYALVIMLICFTLCMALLSVCVLAFQQAQLQDTLFQTQADSDLQGQRFSDWLTGILETNSRPASDAQNVIENSKSTFLSDTDEADTIDTALTDSVLTVTYTCGRLTVIYNYDPSAGEALTLQAWTLGAGNRSGPAPESDPAEGGA